MSVAPAMWQIAYSWGSRTSTSKTFSPRSRRSFNSRGVISRSFISLLKKHMTSASCQEPRCFHWPVERRPPRTATIMNSITATTKQPKASPISLPVPCRLIMLRRHSFRTADPSALVNPKLCCLLLNRAFGRDPLLFDRLDLADKVNILGLRKHFLQMISVVFFAQHLASDTVGLAGVFADEAIEFHVRDKQLRLTIRDILVDHFNELEAFLAVEFAAVLVHALEVGLRSCGWLIVTAFQTPDVKPMRRT